MSIVNERAILSLFIKPIVKHYVWVTSVLTKSISYLAAHTTFSGISPSVTRTMLGVTVIFSGSSVI